MIGKQKKGQDFRGAVNYVMNDKKGADILGFDGVILDSKESIIKSFEAQAEMNPRLTKNVGHHILSFSSHDAPRMTDEFMLRIAKEYLERMKITDTQYLIVRHYDRDHPHMHIVFNRVNHSRDNTMVCHNIRKNASRSWKRSYSKIWSKSLL